MFLRRGEEDYRRGRGYGGRHIPAEAIRALARDPDGPARRARAGPDLAAPTRLNLATLPRQLARPPADPQLRTDPGAHRWSDASIT
jgi:hypothetical protein